MTYDPVPDLAALTDGLGVLARHGGSENLGELLTGPYARLRGGLLLDEPALGHLSTEQALRLALRVTRETVQLSGIRSREVIPEYEDRRVREAPRTGDST